MSTLLGLRCSDDQLVLQGLYELLQHSVQVCCDHIDAAHGGPGAAANARVFRQLNAALLNKAPLLCVRLRDTARTDERYAAVMYYERTRLGATNSGHFLEALPAGLTIFSGVTNLQLRDDDLAKLKLRDVINDRQKTINNLEALSSGSNNLKRLVSDYRLADAAAGLPGRVHVYISRQRAICQGLQRVKPVTHFKQCKNGECSRLG